MPIVSATPLHATHNNGGGYKKKRKRERAREKRDGRVFAVAKMEKCRMSVAAAAGIVSGSRCHFREWHSCILSTARRPRAWSEATRTEEGEEGEDIIVLPCIYWPIQRCSCALFKDHYENDH